MTRTVLGSSFRDRSGSVFESDGILYREIADSYRDHYDALISTDLYDSLTDAELLVRHEEVDGRLGQGANVFRVIRPERIPFISYPYEWSFGALKDAALATLRVQSLALDRGMTLKDASAFNIQFVDGKPILIDTLSFELYEEGTPWKAYRQFCQHFLAPLALMDRVDVRLGQLSRSYIDGVPLDLASEILSRRGRLSLGTRLHVHSHARSVIKHSGAGIGVEDVKGRFSMRAFRALIDNLESTVRGYEWEPSGTWAGYYSEADHYPSEASQGKQEVVGRYLDEVKPSLVLDLGANTGLYSRMATARGALAVSLDADPAAVELNYRRMVAKNERKLLPLVFDLTDPSPAIGWSNAERDSLDRRGRADVAMALALIHHLTIGNNVPFALVAAYLGTLCTNLIVEYVPKDDPKVQFLLRSREDVFSDYTQGAFEDAFQAHFDIVERVELPSSVRTVYLMKAR